MTTLPIDAANQAFLRAYILRQFSTLSWWPAEGPLQAREAFDALDDSPEALASWCQTWLDGGQWRQMRAALRHSMDTDAVL